MPPSSAPAGPSSSSKKQPTVIPAIPLALSRPKPKQKPKDAGQNASSANDATRKAPMQETGTGSGVLSNGTSNNHPTTVDVEEETATTTMPAPQSMSASATHGVGDTSFVPALDDRVKLSASTDRGTPSTTTSATSSQPSADRASRQNRTELPPAFIPSAESHTPQSMSSSTQSPSAPQFPPRGHSLHHSTSSIVFGGMNSNSSSPVPAGSIGSAFKPPVVAEVGPASALGTKSTDTFVQPAHQSSHVSPSGTYPVHQSYTPPSQGSSFQQSSHTPQSRHGSQNIQFSGSFPYQNGDSFTPRSTSQTSSGPQDAQNDFHNMRSPVGPGPFRNDGRDPKATYSGRGPFRPPTFLQPMPPPSQYPHPDVAASLENAETLRTFVLSQFRDTSTADCRLYVEEAGDGASQTFEGHSIILSRSPLLATLIRGSQQHSGPGRMTEVNVQLHGRYSRLKSFIDAIRYLYGGPVLSVDPAGPLSPAGEQPSTTTTRLEVALQQAAVGCFLQIPAFTVRAIEVAGHLLRWDTIALALGFALEGGLSHIWTVENDSEERSSPSSSNDSLNQLELSGSPVYDPFSTNLLQRIVGFIVHMFPPTFYLDTSAPELQACPRLPSIPLGHESRPSRSDPRLSQIRFGEVPVEDLPRPSFATSSVSSVLLSLPFALLKVVLEHFDLAVLLGSDTVGSIMRQVVAEREVRRTRTLHAHSAEPRNRNKPDALLVPNMYWVESVERSPAHRCGFRLARRRGGVDTPNSSGAASELVR